MVLCLAYTALLQCCWMMTWSPTHAQCPLAFTHRYPCGYSTQWKRWSAWRITYWIAFTPNLVWGATEISPYFLHRSNTFLLPIYIKWFIHSDSLFASRCPIFRTWVSLSYDQTLNSCDKHLGRTAARQVFPRTYYSVGQQAVFILRSNSENEQATGRMFPSAALGKHLGRTAARQVIMTSISYYPTYSVGRRSGARKCCVSKERPWKVDYRQLLLSI